jgi:hypothetical protein
MEEPESALTPTPAPRVRETAVTAATARDREPGPAPESLTHPDPGGLAGDERAGERGDPPCGTPVSRDLQETGSEPSFVPSRRTHRGASSTFAMCGCHQFVHHLG